MQQRYIIAKGWAIFSYILCAIFAGAGITLICFAVLDDEQIILYLSIGIALLAFGACCFIGIYRGAIIVGDESITYQGPFTKNRLLFIDIKGFSINKQNNGITLIPHHSAHKKMRLGNIYYLQNFQQFRHWIYSNFTNLDTVEYKEAMDDILQDRRLGVTDTERHHQLLAAKRVVTILTTFIAVFLFVSIYAIPFSNWFIIVSLCQPIVCFMVLSRFKGVVRFYGNEKGAHPIIGAAVMFSGFGLMLKAISDCPIYNYYTLWLVVGLAAAVLFTLTFQITKNEPKQNMLARVAIITVFAITFAYGSVTVINCYYDRSTPVIHKVVVLNKRVIAGKIPSYDVALSAWANKPAGEETTVPLGLYNRLAPNDTALVVLKKRLVRDTVVFCNEVDGY